MTNPIVTPVHVFRPTTGRWCLVDADDCYTGIETQDEATANDLCDILNNRAELFDDCVKALEGMLSCVWACVCDDGYKGRRLIDPACSACDDKDEIASARRVLDRIDELKGE